MMSLWEALSFVSQMQKMSTFSLLINEVSAWRLCQAMILFTLRVSTISVLRFQVVGTGWMALTGEMNKAQKMIKIHNGSNARRLAQLYLRWSLLEQEEGIDLFLLNCQSWSMS